MEKDFGNLSSNNRAKKSKLCIQLTIFAKTKADKQLATCKVLTNSQLKFQKKHEKPDKF